ncbi:MAG: ATP-binding protein [Planctomycetes bacterium]|nr:ATP-binding protein [Planctomycetota bacterium]
MTSTVTPPPLSLDDDLLVRLHATLAHRGRNALAVATARLDGLEPLVGHDSLAEVRHTIDQFAELITCVGRACHVPSPCHRSVALHVFLERWCRRRNVPWSCPREASLAIDADLLGSILGELVANALQHAREPHVALHAAPLRIEVTDRGPGVPEERRRWLGEPFFTTAARSLGLGLHRARRIAAALGATLTFHGRHPETGLRVVLDLSNVSR